MGGWSKSTQNAKCKKMQTAKCGGRLLLVVVVLLLWQGLNTIHPGRVKQPYLHTSICQAPLTHGSTTLYFLATVLSKFHVAVLDQQWPIPAKTLSSSSNVLTWGLSKQCYEVKIMDDHLILTWFPVFNSSLVLYWRLTRCPKRERTPPESWSGKAETAKVLQFPLFRKIDLTPSSLSLPKLLVNVWIIDKLFFCWSHNMCHIEKIIRKHCLEFKEVDKYFSSEELGREKETPVS